MDKVDIDKVTINDLAKNLRKAIQKTFISTKSDRKILDSVKNKIELSSSAVANELNSLISLLESADNNPKLKNLITAYEKHLQGLTAEDLKQAKQSIQTSTSTAPATTASFDTLRKRTTEFIKSELPNLPSDKVAALTKVLQLGHSSGVYTFKLVDELRILGRARQTQTTKSGTSLAGSIEKFKRAEFLVSSLIDKSKAKDLIDTFGYDVTNSANIAGLLQDVFTGNISEDQVFNKIKQLDPKNKIVSKTANDYIEYIQFKGKFQLFSTLEKNASASNTSVTLSIENALDNVIKGNVISALSRAGNTVMLANIKKYMNSSDYTKFKQEFGKVVFADKEIVGILTKLVSSKTFNELVVDRVVAEFTKTKVKDFKQKKNISTDIEVPTTKIKINNSKVEKAQKDLAKKLSKSKPLRTTKGQFVSIVNIETLMRSALTETIIKNMERPNLENQTGRFARSVELKSISQRGQTLQAFLTYMKYPYQTFEPGYAQGYKGYDPRRLIDQSVREIATKLVKARLQTVFV